MSAVLLGTHEPNTGPERFWSKVEKTETCWLWTAAIVDGYGRFAVGANRFMGAHRWSYVRLVGPIPDGLVLDHLCRVRNCVNPDHLEPVTNRENLRRGKGFTGTRARQTHCIHGHEFTPENTYVKPNGCRNCRTCRLAQNAASNARRSAVAS